MIAPTGWRGASAIAVFRFLVYCKSPAILQPFLVAVSPMSGLLSDPWFYAAAIPAVILVGLS
ncbi:MAG: hypothetical protein E5X24_29445, partial [Mesorhizobium sp.]